MSDAKDPGTKDELSLYETRRAEGRGLLDLRQGTRLPEGYAAGVAEPFDPRLAYELALEMAPPLETFAKYGYTTDQATALLTKPSFVVVLRKYRDEILAGGVSFKLKARVQAEDLLTHSYEIATDPETPASVRADLIKWTAAVAGLGPPKEQQKGEGASQSAGFTLNISFGGQPVLAGASRPAIDVTPTQED